MAESQIIYKNQDLMAVRGAINYVNVVALRKRGENLIRQMPRPCNISLVDIYSVNTCVVSLLLCWLRYANKHGKSITFIDMPDKLNHLLDLSNLRQLIYHK
jgi:phospholipid transport system transporter-binding protein